MKGIRISNRGGKAVEIGFADVDLKRILLTFLNPVESP